MLRDAGHLISLGFGTGLAPRAPGTFGTLAGIPPILVLWWLDAPWPAMAALALALTVVGIWCAGRTARHLGVHDHGSIVIDEVAGMVITLIAVPPSWLALLAGFGLFRLFDIVKPWPIRRIDARVHGGLGIMADDVAAGLAANLCLQVAVMADTLPGA